MSHKANDIIAQRDAGLISNWEAKSSLKRLAKQAKFNADYADDPKEYFRWTREADAATQAANQVQP